MPGVSVHTQLAGAWLGCPDGDPGKRAGTSVVSAPEVEMVCLCEGSPLWLSLSAHGETGPGMCRRFSLKSQSWAAGELGDPGSGTHAFARCVSLLLGSATPHWAGWDLGPEPWGHLSRGCTC